MRAAGQRPMRLIVGLGNPDPEYQWTPHNLGFHVVDSIAERAPFPARAPMVERRFIDYFRRFDAQKAAARGEYVSRAFVTRRLLGNEEVVLAKPMTYMNESGRSVRDLLWKMHWPASSLVVIVDDVALPWGYFRIRDKGSAGGHKGLASIIQCLGTDAFVRLRLGVGLGERVSDLSDYVLQPLPKKLRPFFEEFSMRAADVVESIVRDGLEWTKAKFNQKAPLASSEFLN